VILSGAHDLGWHVTFTGEHRPVSIPLDGNYEASVQLPVMNTKEGTGQ
jgi:hypothetical protein